MSTRRLPEDDRGRSCWVCFATDEDDRAAAWVRPCRCRGTTMWVHQSCLQRWIDEKQKGNSTTKVSCPQCNTEYIIVFPKLGGIIQILDILDRMIYKTCPYMAGGIFFGTVYWTSVTYGAVTVMQVLGHKEGLNVMEGADPLFLLIGLPMIPLFLILGKMVRWEDYLLRLWRKYSSRWPILCKLFPSSTSQLSRTPAESMPLSDPVSATRVLCGALILPTIATMAGKAMFGNVSSNFQRTLLGGFAFVAIKGALKMYYKQVQYIRQANRIVKDYEEPKTSPAEVIT
ncbi:MARH5-like protein [Mya arenaria]|uniref:E3 ubiquitin-protein ligase MARCHF5 n=1 Tax=Mya arenaria TaxID=6604 RepID=A0ABY7FJ39_MYAAR|nr:MARH5-like protein [Mya arenaria]